MKKILLLVLLALAASGCATRRIQLPDGSVVTRREIMPQVGVIMTFQNNCAPMMTIESIYGVEVGNLAHSKSATIPIPTRAFGGDSREIWAMAKAYTSPGQYIGSATLREYVSIYQGTRDKLWLIDRLDSPPGARCPSGGVP